MKKKLSRLLCALLVFTMVFAMVPAVSAASTPAASAANDPYKMYEGEAVSFGCQKAGHTVTATYQNEVEGVSSKNQTKDTYVSYSKTAKQVLANKTTIVTTKSGNVFEGYAKVTLTCDKCTGTEKTQTAFIKVYAKGTGLALRNADTEAVLKESDTLSIKAGSKVTLDYSVLAGQKTTTFTEVTTADQSTVAVDNDTVDSGLTVTVDTSKRTVTVEADSEASDYDGYFDLVFAKDSTHNLTRSVKVVINDGSKVTIKNGKTEVGWTGKDGKTITASIDDTLSLTATSDSGTGTATWRVTQESNVLKALGGGKFKVEGAGEATITATVNKVTASVDVLVLDDITSVEIEGSGTNDTNLIEEKEMGLTDQLTLHVNVKPNSSKSEATHAVWSITSGSANVEFGESQASPKLWTIDEDANTATGEYVRLNAKKVGTFTVKVELGGKSAELTMTIKAATKTVKVGSIDDTELTGTLRNGTKEEIKAQVNGSASLYRYVDATTTSGKSIRVPVEWRTVDKNDSNNTAKIYGMVMSEDDNGTIYDYSEVKGSVQITLTVDLSDDAAVTNITITSDKDTAIADDRVTLTANATVAPSNATVKYQWYVNGKTIKDATKKTLSYTIPKASEDSSTSYKFRCEVTATYKNDSTSATSKEYTVSVSRDYAVSITTSNNKTSFTVGDKPELEVTLTYRNSKVSNPSVTWKLYDEKDNVIDSDLATITGSGSTATVTTKAVKNAKGDKLVVRATVSANGQSFSSSETLTINPAQASTVKQSVGTGAAIKASSITSAVTKAAGSSAKVSYIVFNTPKNCTLSKSSSSSTAISDTKCYVSTSSGQKLSDVYVKTSASSASVTYTAYDADDYVLATGTVSFDANDTNDTIYASGADFKDCGAADQISSEYPTADYVKFDLPKASDGKLYFNYSTIADYESEVKDSDKFYINASSSQDDVEDVYFLPTYGVKGTVSIDYTAYSSSGSDLGDGTIKLSVKQKTASSKFTDVTYNNTGYWAADSIDFMSDNGLFNGTSTYKFSPNATMTRAMLVTVLYRAAGKPSVSGISNPFTDTKKDYYTDAMLWAYKNGIVTGTSATTFSPDANVTREQIAAILYRYMGNPSATGSLTGYTDRARISSFATTAMQWAIGKGYITGTTATTLDPRGNATRAQVAVMLHRFLTK